MTSNNSPLRNNVVRSPMRRTYSKGFGVKAKNEPSAIQIIGINPKLGNHIYPKKRVMTGKERKNNRIP